MLDIVALSLRLGCPVVPMVSTKAGGFSVLKQMIGNHQVQRVKSAGELSIALLKKVATLSGAMLEYLLTEHNATGWYCNSRKIWH